ncbi:cupredoxin-like protein [Winogradskyella wandonensis]|uniref:Cupredoxin-like protein n=1 Tax=Winogradskyella wandonensis TaxID=1442586 RepID=A0A4R1KTY0_9FLAO|nr:cupredoxin domain-containing protein [Winogradskyella wandonensis]TCK67689.1 cupredoxin-like protein [Winogradskyella wandonensis]
MKKIISILVIALVFVTISNAQDQMQKDAMMNDDTVKTISLEQTEGVFTQKSLTLKEGSYIFEIANKNAGTDVGFVLVPKGKDASNPENHIQTAYVTNVVKEGKTETSNTTKLAKGEYVYFCPLNKTPQYTLVVK